VQARGCDWADLSVHVVAVCVAKAGMHSRGAHRHSRAEAGYKAAVRGEPSLQNSGLGDTGGRETFLKGVRWDIYIYTRELKTD